MIKKLKLKNFRRFQETTIDFNASINILIGDNETGKSSILSAIDLVLSGSRSKVENIGLDSLFNVVVIKNFLDSEKNIESLPELEVELYLDDLNNKILEGKYNSEGTNCHGLLLRCVPRDDLSKELSEILEQTGNNFPFEYYSIVFKTFSGEGYTGYRRFFEHLLLDNSLINSEYATQAYVRTLFRTNAEDTERSKYQYEYRKTKEDFKTTILSDLNAKISDYEFALRTSTKSNLETDLTIKKNDVDILDKGKGEQSFIKADFALQKKTKPIQILLFEEPENHLSHVNMKKLIHRLKETTGSQMFISTHNTLISSRLDLRNSILLNSGTQEPAYLAQLKKETAKFFMKAPNQNLLEFILSNKVILVEGHSEYILMEAFYKEVTGIDLEEAGVHIIAVGGKSFARYLDLAKLLPIKTAVVTDNDGNYETNISDRYEEYISVSRAIFAETSDNLRTFELVLYNDNKTICDELWKEGRKTLSVKEFMLANKANCAFELLRKKGDAIQTPEYIKKAIKWIND